MGGNFRNTERRNLGLFKIDRRPETARQFAVSWKMLSRLGLFNLNVLTCHIMPSDARKYCLTIRGSGQKCVDLFRVTRTIVRLS
jgi:hypothetical protein